MANGAVSAWIGIGVATACTVYYFLGVLRSKHEKPLPPGPSALPFIGNLLDFPPPGVPEYLHWLKHKDIHGPISSVTVLGMTLVLVHDRDIADQLLRQAAKRTAGRPDMTFANELCGYKSITLCQGYTDTFRHHRKLLHKELGTKASTAKFFAQQEAEVGRQLARALERPEQWLKHFKTTAAATVLKMTYGYSIQTEREDPLIKLIDTMMHDFSLASVPMGWAVDIIPALRYLPEWFPGAKFQATARRWRKSIQNAAGVPYSFVKKQAETGENEQSYVSRLLDNSQAEESDEDAIMWTAASLYGAAGDTTVITLSAFTLAMVMFPEVQKKAQSEIDKVTGGKRLPTFADRNDLPYVSALVTECLRWWPIAPLGFPHTATEDIHVDIPGKPQLLIPEGAYILPSVWWFLHDPETYQDPETFEPERFLAPRNEPHPEEAFGYGLRICPGRFFADASLYINIAQSLATFDIGKARGEDGLEIKVDASPKPGILCYPADFSFQVTPRGPECVDLIRQAERENTTEPSTLTGLADGGV